MHSVTCPICRNRVEVDFLPVAGGVWCSVCQKLFLPTTQEESEARATHKNKSQQQNQSNSKDT
jgi:hypothetical protein